MNDQVKVDIWVKLTFNLLTGKFKVKTNCNDPKDHLVSKFLETQVGKGKDDSEAVERNIYNIKIGLDMSNDTFYVSHDCGNKGLRDGILLHYLSKKTQ